MGQISNTTMSAALKLQLNYFIKWGKYYILMLLRPQVSLATQL